MSDALPQILDPCCGGRMMWFEKVDARTLFCDIRDEEHVLCDGRIFEVRPDTVADFRALPFEDASFRLVCFDPSHLERAGNDSWMRKKYGVLNALTWTEDLSRGFNECWRVLKRLKLDGRRHCLKPDKDTMPVIAEKDVVAVRRKDGVFQGILPGIFG